MNLFQYLPDGELARLKILVRPIMCRRYFASNPMAKLHLGCGSKIVPGWLNADKFRVSADIYLNAYRRFPFVEQSFYVIYSEHMIEHIKVDLVPFFLREVYRVLRDGGVFRVTCPDLELFVRNYVADDRMFFQPIIARFQEKLAQSGHPKYWLVRTKGGALMSRAVQRFYHHRWMYDFETLERCLREVGFGQIIKQSYGKGAIDEAAALDSQERSFETMYIDAIKN
ncbi:MAG TPA: methyltransferase domain-containing protein [Candidatus Saccharimonadia bacterium]|nr:methyltransferase domain-containing protein [Candidatus Saccharimonadia bacterium]